MPQIPAPVLPGVPAAPALLWDRLNRGKLLHRTIKGKSTGLGTGDEHMLTAQLSFDELEMNLKGVFDRPTYASDATDRLLTIKQGDRSVLDYSVEFWTLVVEGGWNESPLMGVFRKGLNHWLQDALALQGQLKDLDWLISFWTAPGACGCHGNCFAAHRFSVPPSPTGSHPVERFHPFSTLSVRK